MILQWAICLIYAVVGFKTELALQDCSLKFETIFPDFAECWRFCFLILRNSTGDPQDFAQGSFNVIHKL